MNKIVSPQRSWIKWGGGAHYSMHDNTEGGIVEMQVVT